VGSCLLRTGKYIAAAEGKGGTVLLDAKTHQLVRRWGRYDPKEAADNHIGTLVFVRGGSMLLRADEVGFLIGLYNVETGEEVSLPNPSLGSRRFLTVSADGRWLAFEQGMFEINDNRPHHLEICDPTQPRLQTLIEITLTFDGLANHIEQAAFFEGSSKIAIALSDRPIGESGIQLFESHSGDPIRIPEALVSAGESMGGLTASPDSRYLSMLGVNAGSGDLRVYNLQTAAKGKPTGVLSLDFGKK